MYYRVAIRREGESLPSWQWKSTALSSLQTLFQWFQFYRALPHDRLRIFFSTSREEINEQLVRENQGLGSTSVTAAQFLQERMIRSPEGIWGTADREARGHQETASTRTRLNEGGRAIHLTEGEEGMNQRDETRYAKLVTLSEEEKRLERQGRWLAPLTRCFLQMAGITEGMHVLDVGCGVGDVSLLLAEQVGPDGSVTGIDRTAGFLEIARRRAQAATLPNVTFAEGDLATVDLAGSYDAVVGRLVLGFLQERSAILRRLAAQVRPGGVVAFQEIDLTATGTGWPAAPLFQRVAGWVIEVFRRNRLEIGLQLYGLFLEAGLPAPQMALLAPVGGGPEWPGYENLAHVIRSLLPILLTQEIAQEEEIAIETLQERLREEMTSSCSAAIALGLMSIWTRLP